MSADSDSVLAVSSTALLGALPRDHQLRNSPLHDIGAQVRWKKSVRDVDWRPVRAPWQIAKATYNDLGLAWTESDDFRVCISAPNVAIKRLP